MATAICSYLFLEKRPFSESTCLSDLPISGYPEQPASYLFGCYWNALAVMAERPGPHYVRACLEMSSDM
jgi:hypothetical protein